MECRLVCAFATILLGCVHGLSEQAPAQATLLVDSQLSTGGTTLQKPWRQDRARMRFMTPGLFHTVYMLRWGISIKTGCSMCHVRVLLVQDLDKAQQNPESHMPPFCCQRTRFCIISTHIQMRCGPRHK
jgi:hypothetical protein